VCVFVDVGTLPDGVYGCNTKIFFCCRSDGPADLPILLPTSVPFFLLKYGDHCQKVCTRWVEQRGSKLWSYLIIVAAGSAVVRILLNFMWPQVSTTVTGNHMVGQNTQWRDQEANEVEDIRTNHQGNKAEMVWTRVENGWWQDSETGHILGNECNKPRTRKAEKELERYHTPRFEEHQSGLGRRRTFHLWLGLLTINRLIDPGRGLD